LSGGDVVTPPPGGEGPAVDRASGTAAIVVRGVSKRYRAHDRRPTLAEALSRWITGRRQPAQAVCSLSDVSFDVARGDSLGVVGHNGAGKTTLLKILAGIAHPSSGHVQVRGRVATQLALGSGFQPYLSGRDNVFLQGTLLGLTNHDVAEREAEIVAFAGLEDAIARPLWTYSSGMAARLGFAVATHARFDVLLLDEALSAGDVSFRERCSAALDGFRRAGKTLVIVSHGADSIRRLCDRALWLDHGRVRELGPAREVVATYENVMRGRA
jgi:ABC-type polysaccharide/polyol phosphate transport system ATPase subunit